MMNTSRFAAAIAFSRDRRQRWRQISLAVAAAIATTACLLSIALPLAAVDAYERGIGRGAVWDPELVAEPRDPVPTEASAAIVQRASVVDGAQIPTIWIEPLPGHEDDPAIVPVGLDELPAPGTAVLSPALQREGYGAENFGWKPSAAGAGNGGAIGDDGLMTDSERLIYVRPAEGRTLGSGPSVWFTTAFHAHLPDGAAAQEAGGAYFVTDPEIPPPNAIRQGAVIFVLIPALVLVISAVRARSVLREQRLALMVTFGVRASVARRVLALETGMLAAAGAAIAVVLYPLVVMLGRHIPGTRIVIAEAGLTLPWWAFPSAAATVVAVACIGGAVGRLEPKGARKPIHRVRPYGLVLFALSLLCLALSSSPSNPLALVVGSPREAQSALLAIGVVGAMVTIPFAVPVVTEVVAHIVGRSRRVALWAAGRRLRFDAVRLSRVASTVSIFIVVISTATALVGASAAADAERSRADAALVVRDVSWRAPHPGDVDDAARHLEAAGIDATILPVLPSLEERQPPLLVVEDCAGFVTLFGGDGTGLCDAQDREAFADFVSTRTGLELAQDGVAGEQAVDSAVVVSPNPLPVGTMQQALGFLPGLNIEALAGDITSPLPIRQWITAGALSAFVLLGMAVLREVGDRSIEDAECDAQFMRLGLSARAADAVGWFVMLVPLVSGVLLAFVASVFVAYQGQAAQVMHGDPVQLAFVAAATLVIAASAILVAGPARKAARRH